MVLQQVVKLHYRTCSPVPSRLIWKSRVVPHSPATIRSIMMALEHEGLLAQPHTSAGRLPTDSGYRSYVNQLMLSFDPLSVLEKRAVDAAFPIYGSGVGLLRSLAELLHRHSGVVGFFIPFRHTGLRLRRLILQLLDRRRVLALVLARCGQALQQILPLESCGLDAALLSRVEAFLNREFEGRSLVEMRQELIRRLQPSDGQLDLLLAAVTRLVTALEEGLRQLDRIEFVGFSRMFELPEFSDREALKTLYCLLEEQSKIQRLISMVMDDPEDDTWVWIGSEMKDPDLENLSFFVTKVKNGDDWLGCVGLLGPKRMPYWASVPLLYYAKKRILEGELGMVDGRSDGIVRD